MYATVCAKMCANLISLFLQRRRRRTEPSPDLDKCNTKNTAKAWEQTGMLSHHKKTVICYRN